MRWGGRGIALDLSCLLKVGKMTKLEEHLEGIINVFHRYSVRVGDPDTLSKGELKQLITRELTNTLQVGDTLLIQTCPLKGWSWLRMLSWAVGQGIHLPLPIAHSVTSGCIHLSFWDCFLTCGD